jgi:hypothetical protein
MERIRLHWLENYSPWKHRSGERDKRKARLIRPGFLIFRGKKGSRRRGAFFYWAGNGVRSIHYRMIPARHRKMNDSPKRCSRSAFLLLAQTEWDRSRCGRVLCSNLSSRRHRLRVAGERRRTGADPGRGKARIESRSGAGSKSNREEAGGGPLPAPCQAGPHSGRGARNRSKNTSWLRR